MNVLSQFAEALFNWTWETSVHATFLILLVFLLQKLLARWLTPRLRYAFSLLILLRLLLPIVPSSVLSFENFLPSGPRFDSPTSLFPMARVFAGNATSGEGINSTWLPGLVPSLPRIISVQEVCSILWVSGLLGLLLLAIWRWRKWLGLIQQGRPISDPKLLAILDAARLEMRVRKPVALIAIPEAVSPAVFGIWRCRLLLPENVLDQLNDQDFRMIFLHEMAHVRRKDMVLNYLLMGVQFLHWFNPLVWLAMHRLRVDRELVCDAMVMAKVGPEERLNYGRVLLKLMDGFAPGHPVFSGAVPVIGSMSEIKRRILMIKNHRTASMALCVTTTLVILTLALGAFTQASHRQNKPAMLPYDMTFQKGGPVYKGQTLGYWTIKLKQGNLTEQAEAQEALHDLGPKAVPYLVQLLDKEDAEPRQWKAYAASALGEIGAPASSAIPALQRMANDTNDWAYSPAAAEAALMKIEGQPIDGLIRALNGPVSKQWVATAQTLAEFGPKASPAIPRLCRALTSDEGWAAAYAIGFIHSQPEIAVPALIDAINRGRGGIPMNVSGNAIWALGAFESDASPAIPLLRQHLLDPDPMDRLSALESLRRILPSGELGTLVPALVKNVNDRNPNLKIYARGMLAQIDPGAAKQVGVAQ